MAATKSSAAAPQNTREGMAAFRFIVVLGSMAPLFVLLAIRGAPTINGLVIVRNITYTYICVAFAIFPTLILALRMIIAVRAVDKMEMTVGTVSDHRDHLLVYMIAMVIPLYQNNYASKRDVAAGIAVLGFVVFLFVHANLHYMNLALALAGYRIYTVEPPNPNNSFSGGSIILLTRRTSFHSGMLLTAYRISNKVLFER